MVDNPQRYLPSIKNLQDAPEFKALEPLMDTFYLTHLTKGIVDDFRRRVMDGSIQNPTREGLQNEIVVTLTKNVTRLLDPSPKRVINATGVVLHTNLGRARLGESTVRAVKEVAENYSTLEYDTESGERGSRHDSVEDLLCLITGAEAAMVVNNNAAAVFLILRAFGKGKEVIVSRGELVEIGGSFRISSIMEESDAKLIEVGTTNKTHLYDYERAITDETSLLLKVHKSNFAITGFTEDVSGVEISELATKHGLIFYEDLGSGAVFDFAHIGVGDEPAITHEMTRITDLLSASGDKLFGGPQAGIILGKKELVDKLKKHQLARTLRVDKMTLAALNETLKAYLLPDTIASQIPTVGAISQKPEQIKQKAVYLYNQLLETAFQVSVERVQSRVGGGTMPTTALDSYAVTLKQNEQTSQKLASLLRKQNPPIISYVQDDRVWLDLRTIQDPELEEVIGILKTIG